MLVCQALAQRSTARALRSRDDHSVQRGEAQSYHVDDRVWYERGRRLSRSVRVAVACTRSPFLLATARIEDGDARYGAVASGSWILVS
jgi:hypothetical protein